MSRARRLGTEGENAVVDYFQANGHRYAERRALAGNKDKGDVAGIPGVVIEVKRCHARMELATCQSEHHRRHRDTLEHGLLGLLGHQFSLSSLRSARNARPLIVTYQSAGEPFPFRLCHTTRIGAPALSPSFSASAVAPPR